MVDDLSAGRPGRLPEGAVLHRESILDAARLTPLVTAPRPELICHLAAQVDVLEAARAVDARVVMASTGGAIYGKDAPVPSAESVPPEPESPYGISKYCAEQYVGLYNRLYGTAHAILRFANVYGPRQSPSGEAGVVTIFALAAIRHKPLTIYGDGKQTRDYVYVGDCVAAFLAAAEHARPGIWNIGNGTEVSVLELATRIATTTGDSTRAQFAPPRAGELQRSALVPEQARRVLGWQPAMPLAEGVEAVVRWLAGGAPDRALS